MAVVSAAGLIYFGQQFFNSYEKAADSNLQLKLLMLQPIKAERLNEFIQEKTTTLSFVGDIMLSRGVANQIKKHQDYNWPFLKIASTTQEADLVFANLEGQISSRGVNQGSVYSFRVSPELVEGLKFAGFDVLSLANNHIFDWGSEALTDTINILKNNGIEPVGAGKNYQEANSPVIKEINGSTHSANSGQAGSPQVKIAFLAYTNLYPKSLYADENSAGISDFDLEKIKSKIEEINGSTSSLQAKTADIIIISLHWGDEYQTQSNINQQDIAHQLIEAGADLIVGHHPHVVQEIEQYQNGWIAYSLGNFVFDQNFSKETMEGLILKVIIKNKKISEITPLKIKINNAFQPELVEL